jgi:hypothetical protein
MESKYTNSMPTEVSFKLLVLSSTLFSNDMQSLWVSKLYCAPLHFVSRAVVLIWFWPLEAKSVIDRPSRETCHCIPLALANISDNEKS